MSADPRLQTRLCELFGVEHPIVQTGMGWVSGARLTAATSNAGGLGIIAAAPLTFDQMVETIDAVAEATDRPFGVNLRTDAADIDLRSTTSSPPKSRWPASPKHPARPSSRN